MTLHQGVNRPQSIVRTHTDPDLVRSAQACDEDALAELGVTTFRRLLPFYRYAGITRHDAEDLAAEAVAVVVGTLGDLRSPIAFDAWMWSVGRNKLRGHLRLKKRGAVVDRPMPAGDGPEEIALRGEEHREIREALAALNERDREVLWLREVDGLSFESIGVRLGASPGAVRVACHRARRRLEAAYRGNDANQ